MCDCSIVVKTTVLVVVGREGIVAVEKSCLVVVVALCKESDLYYFVGVVVVCEESYFYVDVVADVVVHVGVVEGFDVDVDFVVQL